MALGQGQACPVTLVVALTDLVLEVKAAAADHHAPAAQISGLEFLKPLEYAE